jgi:hypothetical protein
MRTAEGELKERRWLFKTIRKDFLTGYRNECVYKREIGCGRYDIGSYNKEIPHLVWKC